MKLVILDRDGVINRDSDHYVKSVDEFQFIDGSLEAIAALSENGFKVVVATNQSGLARGLFDVSELEAMHQKLVSHVESAGGNIAGIFYCPHGPDDNCRCRKPLSGLIDAIEEALDTKASGWPIVGDSFRDLEAGVDKGCLPILVRTGKGIKTEKVLSEQTAIEAPVFDDLQQASRYIIAHFTD